jgi:hypothetical protein
MEKKKFYNIYYHCHFFQTCLFLTEVRQSKLECLPLAYFFQIVKYFWVWQCRTFSAILSIVKDKHSSLFWLAVSDEQNKFYSIDNGLSVIKLFMVVIY